MTTTLNRHKSMPSSIRNDAKKAAFMARLEANCQQSNKPQTQPSANPFHKRHVTRNYFKDNRLTFTPPVCQPRTYNHSTNVSSPSTISSSSGESTPNGAVFTPLESSRSEPPVQPRRTLFSQKPRADSEKPNPVSPSVNDYLRDYKNSLERTSITSTSSSEPETQPETQPETVKSQVVKTLSTPCPNPPSSSTSKPSKSSFNFKVLTNKFSSSFSIAQKKMPSNYALAKSNSDKSILGESANIFKTKKFNSCKERIETSHHSATQSPFAYGSTVYTPKSSNFTGANGMTPRPSDIKRNNPIKRGQSFITPNSGGGVKTLLLKWLQSKLNENSDLYHNTSITNFSSSWANGLSFCAIVHYFFPEAFEYSELESKNVEYNLELAFSTAEKLAGCCRLIDVEDMLMMGDKPDAKCIFTYVSSLYSALRKIELKNNNNNNHKNNQNHQNQSS